MFQVRRAGSRPLTKETQPKLHGEATRHQALQNDFGCREKVDPYKVMLQAVDGNPLVGRAVKGPAEVAAMIELFPVSGVKTNRPRRADPDGTPQERYAWSAWRRYVDDCGSQENLIRRHMEAKLSTGRGVQIKWETDDGNIAYEFVQNVPWVIEERNGKWIWHPERGVDRDVIEVREVYTKGFQFTDHPSSALMPLCDLIALWELLFRALGKGVETDLLVGGILAMPAVNDDWTDKYADWLKGAKDLDTRLPFPISYPLAGKPPVWLEGGGTIQDNLLKLHELIIDLIAMTMRMDAKTFKEGIGSGTHWNGILLQRDNMQSFIWPTLRLEVLNDVAAWPFRPLLANNELGIRFDLDDWGIGGDWQRSINQPDQGASIQRQVENGFVKQQALVPVLGINEEDLLLPSDPEFEDWATRCRIKGSSSTDEEGGPGSETFGDSPDHESDSSTQPNPTERSELVAAGGLDWDEFGEW